MITNIFTWLWSTSLATLAGLALAAALAGTLNACVNNASLLVPGLNNYVNLLFYIFANFLALMYQGLLLFPLFCVLHGIFQYTGLNGWHTYAAAGILIGLGITLLALKSPQPFLEVALSMSIYILVPAITLLTIWFMDRNEL